MRHDDEIEDESEFDPPKHLIADEDKEEARGVDLIEEELRELEEKIKHLRGGRAVPKSTPSPFRTLRSAMGGPTPTPTPPTPVIPDLTKELKGLHEIAKASDEVDRYLGTTGIKPGEFLDRNCEKITPLYRYLNEENVASIVVTVTVYKGIKTSMAISAKKLSGAVTVIPDELHPILASATFGAAIPEMKEIGQTYDVTTHFKMGEDMKLKMYYKVMDYKPEAKLDSYITILDPDMMI